MTRVAAVQWQLPPPRAWPCREDDAQFSARDCRELVEQICSGKMFGFVKPVECHQVPAWPFQEAAAESVSDALRPQPVPDLPQCGVDYGLPGVGIRRQHDR